MQTVLITGASSGFGRLTAERLAKAGHSVFAGIRDGAGRNAEAAASLKAAGAKPVELDVTSDGSVDTAIAAVLQQSGGKLDVVVNNAGIANAGISESFTPDQLRAVFEVNVFGVQRVLRATLPTLRRQRSGLVITVGSILGRVTFPFFGLYGASKFALEAMIDSYRYELSQIGIDFTLVQPSAYPTNIYGTVLQPKDGGRAADYGDVAQIPGAMFATFMQMFQGPNAPDPQDVAAAIAKLIATPAGQRPDRVLVGQPFGADAVNEAVAPIQRAAVEGLGLGHLTGAAASKAA